MTPTRSINSFNIAFGLVTVPVRQYVLRNEESVSFNMLHNACGGRLNQQLRCKACDVEVLRSDVMKGFEAAKDQYIAFTEDELKGLEDSGDKTVEIDTFIDLGAIDPVYFADAHFLGPDKGADRAYRLLVQAMLDTESAAIAQQTTRGKERLICIRPYGQGLSMHALFYGAEMRDMTSVPVAYDTKIDKDELTLARQLVNARHGEFTPANYMDSYRRRLMDLIEEKQQGLQTAPPAVKKREAVVDLMTALRTSLKQKKRARG